MKQLQKVRSSFVYGNNPFIVDSFVNVDGLPSFLRVETEKTALELPPFIKVIKDVTTDDHFQTRNLAALNFKLKNVL